MRIRKIAAEVVTLALSVLLAACGGGGGSTTPAATAGTTRGVINAFGSVIVNGVEFKTAGAKLDLPDDNIKGVVLMAENDIQNQLKVGMVVTVKGVFDDKNGVANEIEFHDALKGKIDNKGVDFLTIMGQKVIVDDAIKNVIAQLNVGDVVQVSGVADDKGMIRATHVEKKAGVAEFEVKGFVANLSGTTFTLLLSPTATSGIDVTLGTGVTLPAGVTNGAFVEVRTVDAGGVITATRVKIEDDLKPAENEKFELEGFIAGSATNSFDDFVVNGQRVQSTAQTLFVGGTKSDFALGMKVEAEGVLANGILTANRIVFKESVRINANVEAVDTAAGTFTLLSKTVAVTSATELKGQNGTPFTLDQTLVGKNVEVRGFLSSDGTRIVAMRADIKNANAALDLFVRGPVTAMTSATTLTIAGIPVVVDAQTQFNGVMGEVVSAADFFKAITLDTTVVKAKFRNFTSLAQPVRVAELGN